MESKFERQNKKEKVAKRRRKKSELWYRHSKDNFSLELICKEKNKEISKVAYIPKDLKTQNINKKIKLEKSFHKQILMTMANFENKCCGKAQLF